MIYIHLCFFTNYSWNLMSRFNKKTIFVFEFLCYISKNYLFIIYNIFTGILGTRDKFFNE
ncbi:Uncharacterised protein [Bifidobacterium longum subsp. infantis]|uniref:Uncharacterized protein n=1 Tax=Bifidobacterium longum subsp. infantis TaxID=1682 RepID=A0A564VHP5_BIFLI|nr:Uncharacterised protein [Bifidobacterium longum subsp. infantis]